MVDNQERWRTVVMMIALGVFIMWGATLCALVGVV